MALENSVGSSNFVDGVSLRVSPAPNEKEIEKQFRTLVLAFQTDQDTLNRRLEIQARARDLAEANMSEELQSMSNVLKEFEQLCFTKDMQDMLSSLKTRVEVLKKSSRRVSSQAEQHGCVQQEARMASGVEVMISHAENLTRHLERVREDLNELRHKERLATDEPITPRTLANGPTRLDSQRVGGPSSSHPHQSEVGEDGTKQNSLLNFVMAFHTTSMRAKEALKSFRRRTEASRQEREASGVTALQSVEPQAVKTDSSMAESTPEAAETNGTPVVVVSGSEGEKDNTTALEDTEEVQGQHEEEVIPEDHSSASPGVDEVKESSENESEGAELESDVNSVPATPKRPGVCWRCLSAAFKFTIALIILLVILVVGITIVDRHSSHTIDRYFILSRIRGFLEPVGQVIYYLKPPE